MSRFMPRVRPRDIPPASLKRQRAEHLSTPTRSAMGVVALTAPETDHLSWVTRLRQPAFLRTSRHQWPGGAIQSPWRPSEGRWLRCSTGTTQGTARDCAPKERSCYPAPHTSPTRSNRNCQELDASIGGDKREGPKVTQTT